MHPLHIINKRSAFDLTKEDWQQFFVSKGMPAFFGKQVYCWIFQKGCLDPTKFSTLSLASREILAHTFEWAVPLIDSTLTSKDGSEKFLLKTKDGLLIEMVIMPYENRVTLCLSCQVGCRMGCTFCQTGKLGFKRNLSSGEILAPLLLANKLLEEKQPPQKISNVVYMGMGEPLDNYEEIVKACRIMIDPEGVALSSSRVTVSTSGLVPEIKKLGRDVPVRLAISLHAADDAKRSRMMPINKTYNLAELKQALLEYPASPRFGITFEYVMIQGVNDTLQDAKNLVRFLHGLKAKVNLIPVNHFPGEPLKASDEATLKRFQSYLTKRSIPAPIRYSRGQDVSGGCGQLAAKREGEIGLDPRILQRHRRQAGSRAAKQ